MLNSFKSWAYSIPTYESPFWDKVDNALSLDDAVNTQLDKFGKKVDSLIEKINFPATKWQRDNSFICSKNWDK